MKRALFLWGLIPGAWMLALFAGPTPTSIAGFFEGLFASAPSPEAVDVLHIVRTFRLPAAVQAFFAGGLLAVSGAVLQTLFKNPLAEPFVLGVSSAGALGLVTASLLGLGAFWSKTLLSFAFGAGAVLFVLAIPTLSRKGLSMNSVILSGIVLNAVLSAMTLFLQSLLDPFALKNSIGLLMGRISLQSWDRILLPVIIAVPFLLFILRRNAELDMLAVDPEHAATAGVAAGRQQKILIIITAFLTAITVSLCGIIGFVGLVAPHAVRFLAGHQHRFLIPLSFLTGGSFLLIAQAISVSLIPMTEIPLGAVTALAGGPVFIIIIIRYGRFNA